MAFALSNGLFRPDRGFRTFATKEEADAFDDGLAAFRAHTELPPREPPLTPAQAAFRIGWYSGERRHFDNVPDGDDS